MRRPVRRTRSLKNYEDLARGIGILSEFDARRFLQLVHTYGRDENLLTMLSLETADEPASRRKIVDARLSALKQVTDEELRPDRDWSVSLLDEYASSYLPPRETK